MFITGNDAVYRTVISTTEPETSQEKRVTAYDDGIRYTVTNLVTNGSFTNTSATPTGWSTSSTSTNNTVVGTKTNDGLYINDTNTSDGLWNYYHISLTSGHIYYFALENKLVSAPEHGFGYAMYAGSTSTYSTLLENATNQFLKSSLRFDGTGITRLQFGSSMASISSSYTKNVMLIDLTATFGAGNEPSKEWCDENLEYFDGSTIMTLDY